ncbi:redoxin domain-containing protein [Candidatus Palauibacter sp.]|uniref:redoxin domain-containing protein n=1 Tax=Candidatus Palauibacter sp. TaxID=3101350 RepID=UPI003B018806
MSPRSPRRALWLGLLLACGACGVGGAAPDYTAEELEAAKAQLRDHARLRTFEAGLPFGEEWVARVPDDAELRALYARQLAGWGLFRELHAQADRILSEDEDDPWGLYVRALAYLAEREYSAASEPSLGAWEASPRPEFLAAHIESIRGRGAEHLLALFSTLDSATLAAPEVLAIRAEIEFQARYELGDPTWADSSLASYAELRARWPDHVDGYLRPAENLFMANRPEEALPLVERTLALAPGSADARSLHWRILAGSSLLSAEQRRPAVEAGMAEFVDAAPETVRGLYAMAEAYRRLGDGMKAAELETRVVERAPHSLRATLISQNEYQEAGDTMVRLYREEGRDSPAFLAQLEVVRDAVDRYLARPIYADRYRASAYTILFEALNSMDPVPAEPLAEAVRGFATYERAHPVNAFGIGAAAMVDHTPYAREAAEIARSGLQTVVDAVAMDRHLFRTEGEFEEQLRFQLSRVYDAMGWGYFKAGRIEDGRHVLERALALEGRNREARYHLGQVYEHFADESEKSGDAEAAVEWLDRAEDSYIAGLGSARVGENPSQAAIEALYERRNGSRNGIEDYLATLDERDQIRRRERILESRVEAVGTYEPFRLPRLDGSLVDSADLEGRIGVLHFWGTWCGPCIVEMPEYQKFDLRYRDDPDVRVVSISNDASREVVEEYFARNGFDFQVLMDDGYVQRAGIGGWPTTWFVDRDGYVQFVKVGNTSKLDEEFSWRVEAIREAADGH